MDTVTNIPIGIIEDADSLHLADLTEEERILLINHVALTRDITEANQLFEVFCFNLIDMHNYFVFKMNNTVTKTDY